MTDEEKAEILESTENLWNERNRLKELEKENEKLNKKIRRYEEMLGSMFAACNMITQEQSKYEELRRL